MATPALPGLQIKQGRSASDAPPFRAKVHAVDTDMSAAYISAVLENLPGISLAFGHFHMVELMNEAFTQIRRGLHYELKGVFGKKVLKGTRWILLKNSENPFGGTQ